MVTPPGKRTPPTKRPPRAVSPVTGGERPHLDVIKAQIHLGGLVRAVTVPDRIEMDLGSPRPPVPLRTATNEDTPASEGPPRSSGAPSQPGAMQRHDQPLHDPLGCSTPAPGGHGAAGRAFAAPFLSSAPFVPVDAVLPTLSGSIHGRTTRRNIAKVKSPRKPPLDLPWSMLECYGRGTAAAASATTTINNSTHDFAKLPKTYEEARSFPTKALASDEHYEPTIPAPPSGLELVLADIRVRNTLRKQNCGSADRTALEQTGPPRKSNTQQQLARQSGQWPIWESSAKIDCFAQKGSQKDKVRTLETVLPNGRQKKSAKSATTTWNYSAKTGLLAPLQSANLGEVRCFGER